MVAFQNISILLISWNAAGFYLKTGRKKYNNLMVPFHPLQYPTSASVFHIHAWRMQQVTHSNSTAGPSPAGTILPLAHLWQGWKRILAAGGSVFHAAVRYNLFLLLCILEATPKFAQKLIISFSLHFNYYFFFFFRGKGKTLIRWTQPLKISL